MFWPAHHKYHLGSFFLSALALNERNRRFSEVLRVTAEKTAAKQREDSVTITHVVFNPEQATEFVSYCCSVTQLCLTLCNTMDCSVPGFPALHYFPEFAYVHWVGVVVVLSFSHVRLFVTPWTAAHQVYLLFTISQSLLRLMFNWVSDAIQPSHPMSFPSPPAFNLSQHQSLF